jgi:hypothetical protein
MLLAVDLHEDFIDVDGIAVTSMLSPQSLSIVWEFTQSSAVSLLSALTDINKRMSVCHEVTISCFVF